MGGKYTMMKVDRNTRKVDMKMIVDKLDITPTMYKNAIEKYRNLSAYLQKQGINSDIYPQGSFALGTVVRPYRNSKEMNYDLDFICLLNENVSECNPKDVKMKIGNALKDSEVYSKILQEEYDRCWTLEYAEIGEVGFNMDIVPAVPSEIVNVDNDHGIEELKYRETKISITNKKSEDLYDWIKGNPKGYKEWFLEINKPFLEHDRSYRRQLLFESHRHVFNSIEEITEDYERSSLQRVIQILKRHRDVYFSKTRKENDKPITAIITTLAAQIANEASKDLDVFELLEYIVREFNVYSEWQVLSEATFIKKYSTRNFVRRVNGKWQILNPVNSDDNLADAWNGENNKAKCFFEWIKAVQQDFIYSLEKKDEEFITLLENSMGTHFVRKSINTEKYTTSQSDNLAYQAKPWRN